MEPTEKKEGSGTNAKDNEGRREALKKFGKLAAAAPAAMVLLKSRGGSANCLPESYTCD